MRQSIAIACTLLLIAGCENRQTGVPFAASQTSMGRSSLLSGTSGSDLLYVSNANGAVTVYDFDTGAFVGTLTGFQRPKRRVRRSRR